MFSSLMYDYNQGFRAVKFYIEGPDILDMDPPEYVIKCPMSKRKISTTLMIIEFLN